MTAWSSRADGQNTARELRRPGATRHLPIGSACHDLKQLSLIA
jgi:hypothetical protein